jgi:hypothetical protein
MMVMMMMMTTAMTSENEPEVVVGNVDGAVK